MFTSETHQNQSFLSISAKVFAKQIDKNQIALQMLYFVDAGAKTASI